MLEIRSQNPADFRLLLFGIGIWCGALLAGQFSWQITLFLLLLNIAISRWAPRFVMVGWALLAGSAIYALHFATLQESSLAKLAAGRATVTIAGVITSDVKTTLHKVNGSTLRRPQNSFLIRAHQVRFNDVNYQMRLPVRVLSQAEVEIVPGEKIELIGQLIKTREKRVAATLLATEPAKTLQPAGSLSIWLTGIRREYRQSVSEFNSTAASLIPGMILGDTSLQSEEFSKQMRRSGLSHLTAVSGANFAIVSALVLWLMRFISQRFMVQVGATAMFLVLFLLLVRPSPSVLRAGVMAAVILFARASGHNRNAASALAAAISLLLLLDPFQSQDPGFVLSVLATGGLIFIAPEISRRLRRFLPAALAEVIAVSTAATVLCTPYIMFLSGEISVLSIIFNILVSPFVAPITILGFIAVLVLPFGLISGFFLILAEFLARWVVYISSLAMVTPSWQLNPLFLLLLILVGVALRNRFKVALILFLALLLAINLLPRMNFPGRDWQLAQCDVGQGDALVLNLGQGTAALFDVGPDPTLIDRCLKILKVSELALIVLSHNHADHTFGFSGAVKNRNVGEIWSNGNVELEAGYSKLNRVVSNLDSAHLSEYFLEVLWPKPRFSFAGTFNELPGDGSRENNLSLVILITKKDNPHLTILVTGDIEPEAQQQIIRESQLGSVAIMKVAHHGSRFQDELFMSQTNPEVALISVGKANSYGHPDPAIVQNLELSGAVVRRTDEDGPISVAWRFDDAAKRYIFTTRTMRKEWWRIQWN